MANTVVIDIKVNNIDKYLGELNGKIAKALEECGQTGENYAIDQCPVDTGRLRNSLTHTVEGNTAIIGTNVEYAPYVELGTSRMRAQPYLKPALSNHVQEYVKIIESTLKS